MSGESGSETLEKGLRILDVFASGDEGFTLGQIAERVGFGKTSVHRYVSTFCELGYLRRDESAGRSGQYHIGARALSLSHSLLRQSTLVQLVKPLADEAHERRGAHVDVGLLDRDAIYLIYRRETADTLAFKSYIYGSEPHCLASGKAALAFLPPEEMTRAVDRLALAARTGRTITCRAALLAQLAEARERGYAVNDEEFVPGLIAIGAPIFSQRTGRVVGGVSFDSSTDRFSMAEFERELAAPVVALAKKISAAIRL